MARKFQYNIRMKLLSITKANDGVHKLKATFENDNGRTKTTKFGAVGYDDYTTTGSEERKKLYIDRHQKDMNTHDPTRAGYLSRYILWNQATVNASIRDYKRRFNL